MEDKLEIFTYGIAAIYLATFAAFAVAGFVAARGRSFWATSMMAVGGCGMLGCLIGFLILLAMIAHSDNFYEPSPVMSIFLLGGILISGLLFAIGTIAFCGRFGGTCRRIAQLEELSSALAAAVDARQRAEIPNPL